MTEYIEHVETTPEDLVAEAEKAPYHSILEVWRAVLAPAEAERDLRITPQWANRIVASYRGIEFADMPKFRDMYFDQVQGLANILEDEIVTDAECLNITSAEEDVERNTVHYLNILFDWQKAIMQRELDWKPDDSDAALEIAVLSEIHKMFFDQTGLVGLLDQINFEFTDSDRQLLASELEDMKNLVEG